MMEELKNTEGEDNTQSGEQDERQQTTSKAAPPSYDSIFRQIKSKKEESSGLLDFVKSLSDFRTKSECSVTSIVFTAIGMTFPIIAIVIGAIYLNDCPAQRFIPIYLVVASCFWIVLNFLKLVEAVMLRRGTEEQNKKVVVGSRACQGILMCFLATWFIAGSVEVYQTYNNWSVDSTASSYCHPTLYWFAFWLITTVYIVLAVMLCCSGFCICCVLIFYKTAD